jgi:hypothetical protein
MVGVVVAERRKIAGSTFYVLAGIATSAVGFVIQHLSEAPGGAGIVQPYALTAFLASGLVGGLVYWVASGRRVAGAAGAPKAKA